MAASPPMWDNLPTACKELRHWVLWKTATRDGKLTKVPIRADSGLNAEADNQTTWTTFDKVREAFEKGIGGALGVGFVFARASNISGVDLDHCRDPATGDIDAWAKAYLDRLGSYSEISPSGAGLHVLVKGAIPVTGADGGRQKKLKGDGYRPDAAIEMYSAKRFFTTTGNVLTGYPQGVESREDELIAIYEEVFGKVEPQQSKTQERGEDGPEKTSTKRTVDDKAGNLSDKAVIARMLGGSNADAIERLLRGDISAYENDDSRADQALCNHFAFWTGKNRPQMDRIFRTSKLMRPKWDEKRGRQTYGEMTIDKACRDTTKTYDSETYESVSQDPPGDEVKPKGRPTTVKRVIDMLLDQIRLDESSKIVTTGTGKTYLWITASDHQQLFDLNSEDFRIWLAGLYAERYKGAILRTSAIKDAKEALISQLRLIREPIIQELQLRTTKKDDAVYYDLGSDDWRCVKISSSCVKIEPMPLGLKRTKTQSVQIVPDLTATPDDLDELVNKMRIKEESDRLLVKAIACAGIMPDTPHPIMWIIGGQGSGKSLRARMLKSVIDPSILDQTSLPDNRKDLGVLLSNCYCLVLDNVDAPFTSWQVEMLCQAVTGGAQVARELFSNGEIAINTFNRGVLIFTSIGIVTNAPDLLDRALILPVDDIPATEKRSENKLWEEFENVRPKILGAVFESIKRALVILPQVMVEAESGEWEQVRMADFAIFGEALARGAWNQEAGTFLEAYRKRINATASEIVGGDLAMDSLRQFIQDRYEWTGTAKELLRALQDSMRFEEPGWLPPSKGWPRTPNALGMKLKKYAVDLERQGIKVDHPQRSADAKIIQIKLVPMNTPANEAEELRIKQKLADRSAGINIKAFAEQLKVDKIAVLRTVHHEGWKFDQPSRCWCPPP